MSVGMSNLEIEIIFKNMGNDDLNENFLSIFPSNKINKFISFKKIMPGLKYLFLIANTKRSDKRGKHWWSILNISPSNGIKGLKNLSLKTIER